MLQLRETRIVTSYPSDVVTGVTVPEEGVALVYAKENGDTKVQPSTGAAGEIFAGVSFSRNAPPGMLPLVIEGIVKADNTFKLPRVPVAGQLLVTIAGAALTIVLGAPAAATEVNIANDVLTFSGNAGNAFSAQFLYAPSVIEARSIIGDVPVGGLPSSALSSIGVLKVATVSTNFYDASADWSNAMYVKTGLGGKFLVGDAADHVPNVVVKNAPNSGNPFLVLTMNVA